MTENELYKRSDETLGPFLIDKGFHIAQPGEYLRRTEAGEDRIGVSRGPPSKAKTHFAVFMSYEPDYLKPIYQLISLEGEDRGFLCGPYLNPVAVTQRPKYWSYRDPETLANSLRHVLQCLEQTGLPWLEMLRDPKVFASNVDPVAALPAGLAHEVAGNHDNAAQFYREMLRRLQLVLDNRPSEQEWLALDAKPFIFVATKLGVEREKREELQRRLNYYPNIEPLPR